MKPFVHAQNSARKFGGKPEDYQAVHDFFDHTKAHVPDMRHRAVLHNSFGIYLAERLFGATVTNSDGKKVSVRDLGEDHVMEDLGLIPTLQDCLEGSLRVLVCGGRNYVPTTAGYAVLASILTPGTTLIHGDASGADRFARDFAKGLGFVKILAFPADWKTHGRGAGPIRNQRMIDEGKPDVVIAFPGGRGTADMVRRARAAGIHVEQETK